MLCIVLSKMEKRTSNLEYLPLTFILMHLRLGLGVECSNNIKV